MMKEIPVGASTGSTQERDGCQAKHLLAMPLDASVDARATSRWIADGSIASRPQLLQKSLNRVGESSVYLTVCWKFRCPRKACKARVSRPLLARANPQAWRSM